MSFIGQVFFVFILTFLVNFCVKQTTGYWGSWEFVYIIVILNIMYSEVYFKFKKLGEKLNGDR